MRIYRCKGEVRGKMAHSTKKDNKSAQNKEDESEDTEEEGDLSDRPDF